MAFTLEQIRAQASLTPEQFAQTAGVSANDYISPTGTVNISPTTQPTQTVGTQYQDYYNSPEGQANLATINQSITSESLAPVTPTNFVAPNPSYTYPVASLDSTPVTPIIQATPAEQEQSGMIDRLKTLYNSTIGKSAYQAEQEKLFGVDELTRTQNDLVSQLTAIKNEAAAIPLQLQQGAADRGVTTTVLGRQENSRLRTNAIAALGVSTLLEAARGNLATAQAMADRAVAQKYDPILEEIAALKANLELIIQDPRTKLQDQNRALAQMEIQNAREEATLLAKQNAQEVWSIATTAASNGSNFTATPQYPSLALTLQAISSAPTKEQALQIASMTGLVSGGTSSSSKILGNSTSGYYTYDPATGQTTPISNPNVGSTSGGGTSGTSGGSTGSIPTNISSRTSQVLDGFVSLSELTPTEAQKVRDQLYAQGFGSDTPPAWFKEYIETELRQSLLPRALLEEWIKYRDNILGGGSGGTSSGDSLDFDNL